MSNAHFSPPQHILVWSARLSCYVTITRELAATRLQGVRQ